MVTTVEIPTAKDEAVEQGKTFVNQIIYNEESIARFGCTEAVERLLGCYYLLWSVTVDISASHYYAWMMIPSPGIWRFLGGALAMLRILSGSLGSKLLRFRVGIACSMFSMIVAFGFFYAGWTSGGAAHLLFAIASLWTVIRLQSRLKGNE